MTKSHDTSTTTQWTLHHGEAVAWLLSLPTNSADAIITDPPYSSGGQSASSRRRTTAAKYMRGTKTVYPEFEGDNRDQRSWLTWMTVWLSQAYRVAKPGAPICLFADWRQSSTASDALQAGGFIWRGTIAWDKTGAARPMRGRFTQQCEHILWGSKGPMPRTRQCLSDSNVLPGVVTHRVDPKDKHHIAGKPTALMRDIVRICEPGGVIVDPFAGSGTTGVAALQLGYRFLGCELSAEYVDIANERLHASNREVPQMSLAWERTA